MAMTTMTVPSLHWYGDDDLTIRFPGEWAVRRYPMAGNDSPPLTDDDIRSTLRHPIESKPLDELARGRREVAIVVDDMTRPTKAYQLIPPVLEELRKGGITRDHVRFIVGLGAHGACNRIDFAKKLGEAVVAGYPVYNHNPFGNLTELGLTSRGTPVSINSEFMDCDLKIGIGLVVPHPQAGFGGGAKIVLPGVASLDTIVHNHGEIGGFTGATSHPAPTAGWGKIRGNVLRLDMEETARMAGLDVKIDAVINGAGQTTALFMGDFVAEHTAALTVAQTVYATERPADPDIVVANTYAKSNESSLAMWLASQTVRRGGTVVLIANAPDGQVSHYIYGKFGRDIGGKLYTGKPRFPHVGRLIVYSPYVVRDPFLQIADPETITWLTTWEEVLEELRNHHPERPRVAVFPNTEIQIPPHSIQL
jgi:nickel-dependent lactate racemase